MSFFEAPTYTNIRKRKRSRTPSVPPLPDTAASQGADTDVANPHSHAEEELEQLALAGLTPNDIFPEEYIGDFPHRPFPPDIDDTGLDTKRDSDDDDDDDDDSDKNNKDEAVYDSDDTASTHSGAGVLGYESDGAGLTAAAAAVSAAERRQKRREAKRRRNALRFYRAQDRHVGVLAGIVERGLQEAEHGTAPIYGSGGGGPPIGLQRAKRAFALLLRSDAFGSLVDLRRNYYWAMGAELLMREGEGEDGGRAEDAEDSEDEDARRQPRQQPPRWGHAANMPAVRTYYEDLIHQYPYNRLWPRSTSALTFWPALVGTELYSVYTEERHVMTQIDEDERQQKENGGDASRLDEAQQEDDEEDEEDDESLEDGDAGGAGRNEDPDALAVRLRRLRHSSLRTRREDVRTSTVAQLRQLARRMDAVMANAPYNTSAEMLRLRGMLSLYLGDLSIVTPPRTRQETADGSRVRNTEHTRARGYFGRLVVEQTKGGANKKSTAAGTTDTVVDEYMQEVVESKEQARKKATASEGGADDDEDEDGESGEDAEDDADGGGDDRNIETEDEDDDDDDYSFMSRPVFNSRPVFTSLPIRG